MDRAAAQLPNLFLQTNFDVLVDRICIFDIRRQRIIGTIVVGSSIDGAGVRLLCDDEGTIE